MGKRTVLITTVISIALGVASIANAGFFLTPHTGNSQFVVGDPESDGLVNFAVYQNTDGNWTDDFGPVVDAAITQLTGGANNALYVYMYQMVNTDPDILAEDPLEHLQVRLPIPGVVTGAGYITNTVFDDATVTSPGATGPGGLLANRLGALVGTAPSAGDANLDGVPSEVYSALTGPGLTGEAAAHEPASVAITPTAIEFSWIPLASSIPTADWSSIVFFTSNYAPVYRSSRVRDFGSTSNEIPTAAGPVGVSPTPEPSNFVMFGGVMVCGILALMTYRRPSTVST